MFVKVVVPLLAVFVVVVSEEQLVGAPVDADKNDPEIQKALSYAVDKHNAQSNSLYTSLVLNVVNVQTQVVAGVKYIFTVNMARTGCKKSEAVNTCDVSSDPDIAQPHECKLAVWSQPWMNSMQLVENTC